MKLKKIASLALAGILAVSMLTACGDTDKKDPASSEDTSTAAGYSAMLGEEAADTLKKAGLDKIVTFADNADDQKALADAVLGVSDTTLKNWVNSNQLSEVTQNNVADVFEDNADLARKISDNPNIFFSANAYTVNTTKIGELWVANSGYSVEQALSKVFEAYEERFEGLVKTAAAEGGVDVNYNYTVSVSVVNKPVTSDTTFVGSVNFIAVTITRTAEIA